MVHSADPRHRGSRKIPRRGRGRDGSRPGEPAEPRWPDYDEPAGPGYHDPRRPGYEEPEYDGPGWPEPAAGPRRHGALGVGPPEPGGRRH